MVELRSTKTRWQHSSSILNEPSTKILPNACVKAQSSITSFLPIVLANKEFSLMFADCRSSYSCSVLESRPPPHKMCFEIADAIKMLLKCEMFCTYSTTAPLNSECFMTYHMYI
jgi:hypothetical protein